jgi:hypothetical protein
VVGVAVVAAGIAAAVVAAAAVPAAAAAPAISRFSCFTDSWFPGYAWDIACCRRCGSHLGWRFTRAGAGLAGAGVAGRVAAAAAGAGEFVVGSPPESPEYMYASDQFEYADSGLSG